jgi:hypothetical protein
MSIICNRCQRELEKKMNPYSCNGSAPEVSVLAEFAGSKADESVSNAPGMVIEVSQAIAPIVSDLSTAPIALDE